MADRPTFTVQARRVGFWWIVTTNDYAVADRVRRFEQIEPAARQALARHNNLDPDAFDVEVVNEERVVW